MRASAVINLNYLFLR